MGVEILSAKLYYSSGLRVLWRAGYVHRDISMGNLLLCETANKKTVCKISDLEYAQPQLVRSVEGSPQHGHKTVSLQSLRCQLSFSQQR